MAQQPDPQRSQSTTSLAKLYNGSNSRMNGNDEMNDPGLDYCNAFWGQGEKGYEVIMARLRGANRTTEELRSFWKERAAIEEDYAKRLAKLSKYPLGKDEIGDLAASLQNVLVETSQQASYHLSLSTEIKQTVEQPTAEFQSRLTNLKKGLQASVEKSYRNKGLQEGHVQKAKEKYESDCLKLNSYTANSALSQGKDLEKVQSKLERVRQTIGGNEQDFRQFVKVLEGTTQKWEAEWRGFCDHVQDLEEDRMVMMKDIMWAFANAVSQVCVEDDGACERIREKLENFEPANDMVAFVRGWGTGDQIPDPPRFVNYSAGEYPHQPTSHPARFQRLSSKPPLSAMVSPATADTEQPQEEIPNPPQTAEPEPATQPNGLANGMRGMSLHDQPPQPISSPPPADRETTSRPFGGVALPGMAGASAAAAATTTATSALPERTSSMPPPPVPPQMSMPEPRVPSRQGPPSPSSRDVNDENDPMARALAELRREPPGPGSIRRNASHRRPESIAAGSMRSGIQPSQSPAPSQNRMSYQQQPASSQGHGGPPGRQQSIDMTLSPPAPGHTAAQLAKSMDDFHRSASRAADKRGSVNYSNYADDVVGAHPASRPSSPAPISPSAQRSPSPAMMQAPSQPATHIADEVLSQYHQSFPGERRERSRSRAASIMSGGGGSRPGSVFDAPGPQQQPSQSGLPPPSPRQGFVGIGAGGGRSPSPGPPVHSPPPSHGGALGPQSLGIALDKSGGVAHDSMAEAYRRQYQEQQQQQQQQGRPTSQYGQQQQQQYGGPGGSQQGYAPPQSPRDPSFGGAGSQRPLSGYGGQPQQQYGQQPQQQQQQQYQPPPQPSYQTHPSYQQQQHQPGYGANGYGQSNQPSQGYGRSASPAPQQQYGRSASPAPPQQNYGYRAPSPQPQYQQYNRTPSPQPGHQQQQQQQAGRSPSPQPNQPPSNTAPTGQWSTTGLPVLFYVKALYDYTAQSAAEFDFQSGDIIAVTSTPEDGWWSGELLDEARRLPGRTDFPSNFVCLF